MASDVLEEADGAEANAVDRLKDSADKRYEGAGDAEQVIHLTRLNGNPLVVNSDLIKCAESSPDTVLTLLNGEKIVVLESCQDVVNQTIAYRARVFANAAQYPGSLLWTPASEAMPAVDQQARPAEHAGEPQE